MLAVNKNLDDAYRLIKMLFKTAFKLFPLFTLLITFFFTVCFTTALASHPTSKLEWALKAPFLSVQFFKKGFDLGSMLNLSADYSEMLCFESAIFSLMMGIPFNCLCIALMLKSISKH